MFLFVYALHRRLDAQRRFHRIRQFSRGGALAGDSSLLGPGLEQAQIGMNKTKSTR